MLLADLAMGDTWSQVMKSLHIHLCDQKRDSMLGGESEGGDKQCSCVSPCQLLLKRGVAPSHCPLLALAQDLASI